MVTMAGVDIRVLRPFGVWRYTCIFLGDTYMGQCTYNYPNILHSFIEIEWPLFTGPLVVVFKLFHGPLFTGHLVEVFELF